MLKIYYGENWSEMDVLIFYKNIDSKVPEEAEIVEEDHDDIPEGKLDEITV